MDLFKRIQDLSAIYDDDGPSATVQERPMFNDGGMLVQPITTDHGLDIKVTRFIQIITEPSMIKKLNYILKK